MRIIAIRRNSRRKKARGEPAAHPIF